jgi:2-dehydro-3-deoxygluconokinase
MDNRQAIAIGECMVELARGGDGRFGLAFGGDTFNTAVYLARAGVPTAYATALGDDPFSAAIRDLAVAEGLDTTLLQVCPGRMPGLYLIETGNSGERTFHYWRDRSPARELPEGRDWPRIAEALARARLVYLSGITLSLYSDEGLERLEAALRQARSSGALITMDSNYRPRGWGGDHSRARVTMQRFWSLTDIALPTFDDEAALWDDSGPDRTIARLNGCGIREIALKQGPAGALVATAGSAVQHVPIPVPVTAIDTTAAGDSFNAAYLAARLAGRTPEVSAIEGHRLAGVVVTHRGAIAPRSATAARSRPSR